MNRTSFTSDITKHSAAHVMAMAVNRLFPNVRVGIGPVTKTGFYYDFEISETIDIKLIQQIEDLCKIISSEALPFQQTIISKENAINLMLQRGQIYKSELINVIPDDEISFYKTGDEFIDLCRGPHVNNTSEIGPIKITEVEDVHWNEDPARPMLKRIHGAVFRNEDELKQYIDMQSKKIARDYIKIAVNDNLLKKRGSHLSFTLKGASSMEEITKKFKDIYKKGVKEIFSEEEIENLNDASEILNDTVIGNTNLKDFPIAVYSRFIVKTLPIKEDTQKSAALFLKLFYKMSDTLLNLDIIEDVINFLDIDTTKLIAEIEYHNPDNSYFKALSSTLQKNLVSHNMVVSNKYNYINLKLKSIDAFGREWEMLNIKLDIADKKEANLPNIGNIEIAFLPFNFMAYLLEENNGKLPKKFAPYRVTLIPVNKDYIDYANEINKEIAENHIKSKILYTNKSFKRRIRTSEINNSEFIIIIGEKEKETNSVSVRQNGIDVGLIKIEELINFLKD